MRKISINDGASVPKQFYFLSVFLISLYIAVTVMFFFLAGEQLHLRRSRDEIAMPAAELATVELSMGNVVEQSFTTEIQRLEAIDVQWGAYYRQNSGTVTMELWRNDNKTIIGSESFDASQITEGKITTLVFSNPVEGLYLVPLTLRIFSNDGQAGNSISPLMNSANKLPDASLVINGVLTDGSLCFSTRGSDYIWTGLHYWKFVALGFVLLAASLMVLWNNCRRGKRSYVMNAVFAMQKYRFLIKQLVSRDFKTKYKRSVLGVFWSFLNPLLMMTVQYFVFSTIFKNDIPHYAVYLLIGIVSFNFFSEACGMSLTSILGNAGLITKVYMPKYIYPLTRTISSMVNFSISLIPLFLMILITGVDLKKSAVLAVYFWICLIVFSMGLGLLLASLMVFFRDMQFLWSVLSMLWMYATPIFYPETILPEQFIPLLRLNPLYHFLKNARICLLDGVSPEPVVYVQCMAIAFLMLLLGAFVFQKSQDKFVLYL